MSASPPDLEKQFAGVVRAHGASLARLCAGYEAEPERRQELRQEVLLALWKALPTFRGEASLRTFVFRVAHNTALKHVRGQRRDRSEPGLPESLAAHTADPEHVLERRQGRDRLLAAIRQLADLDREVVMLHLEGLSNLEVASVTGLSPSNVGTRLSRARTRLTECLEDSHEQ